MPAPLLRHDRLRHRGRITTASVTLMSRVQKLAIESVKLQILVGVVEPSVGRKGQSSQFDEPKLSFT